MVQRSGLDDRMPPQPQSSGANPKFPSGSSISHAGPLPAGSSGGAASVLANDVTRIVDEKISNKRAIQTNSGEKNTSYLKLK
jgi:hypothetical protein